MQTHQIVTVVLPDGDEKHIHHIRVATEPSAEQIKIYRKLDIKPIIKRKRATFKKNRFITFASCGKFLKTLIYQASTMAVA